VQLRKGYVIVIDTIGGLEMRREEVLEVFAWAWLVFSIIGAIIIGFSVEIIVALAVAIQGAVFSVFLLVFSDLARTISILNNKVNNLDNNLHSIVKNDNRTQFADRPKQVINKSNKDIIAETMDNMKGEDDCDVSLVSNVALISLRNGPSDIHSFVGKVEKGKELDVLSRQNEWVQVRTEEGIIGWVKDLYLYKL